MKFEVEKIKNYRDPKDSITALIEVLVCYRKQRIWSVHAKNLIVKITRKDLDLLEEGFQSTALNLEMIKKLPFKVDTVKVLQVVNVSNKTNYFSYHSNPINF